MLQKGFGYCGQDVVSFFGLPFSRIWVSSMNTSLVTV